MSSSEILIDKVRKNDQVLCLISKTGVQISNISDLEVNKDSISTVYLSGGDTIYRNQNIEVEDFEDTMVADFYKGSLKLMQDIKFISPISIDGQGNITYLI